MLVVLLILLVKSNFTLKYFSRIYSRSVVKLNFEPLIPLAVQIEGGLALTHNSRALKHFRYEAVPNRLATLPRAGPQKTREDATCLVVIVVVVVFVLVGVGDDVADDVERQHGEGEKVVRVEPELAFSARAVDS